MNAKCYSLLTPLAILIAAVLLLATNLLARFRPPSYLQDGIAAFERGEYATAIRECSQAIRRTETDIAAHLQLGASYHNYGWHDEALKEYDAVFGLSKYNLTRAMHSAARIWVTRNDTKRAAECFSIALALSPEMADIWYEFGVMRGAAGDTNGAAFCARQAMAIVPAEPRFGNLLREYGGTNTQQRATTP